MFTPVERAQLRSDLLERAAQDKRITGVAVTGSAATGLEDEWSDVDLAFGTRSAANIADVLADWTAHMYEQHLALHHVDMLFGPWTYRVFLLAKTLQVDLGFVIDTEFRALSPAFRLIFGKSNEPRHAATPQVEAIIGMGWLHALHTRSAIARNKLWQAEYMISGVRDNALALACLRHGFSTAHGRGFDLLPPDVTAPFQDSLVGRLETSELARAFRVAMEGLTAEIRMVEPDLAERLREALRMLCSGERSDNDSHVQPEQSS